MRVRTAILGALLVVSWGGCATTTSAPRRGLVEPGRDVVSPTCRTRVRLLAPAARNSTAVALGASALGTVIVWNEQLGEHGALRFLAVDNIGLPRSPSAEVVDRQGTLVPSAIEADGEGHLVIWSESSDRYQRRVDGRGRARGDVGKHDGAPPTTEPASGACAATADATRCKATRGELVLPAHAKVLARSLGGAGDLVIASTASGLQLYALECAAR